MIIRSVIMLLKDAELRKTSEHVLKGFFRKFYRKKEVRVHIYYCMSLVR